MKLSPQPHAKCTIGETGGYYAEESVRQISSCINLSQNRNSNKQKRAMAGYSEKIKLIYKRHRVLIESESIRD